MPENMEAPEEEVTMEPQEQIAEFAENITAKAKDVADGAIEPAVFVEECLATLTEMQAGMQEQAPVLGGLGDNQGLALPDEDE